MDLRLLATQLITYFIIKNKSISNDFSSSAFFRIRGLPVSEAAGLLNLRNRGFRGFRQFYDSAGRTFPDAHAAVFTLLWVDDRFIVFHLDGIKFTDLFALSAADTARLARFLVTAPLSVELHAT